MIKKILVIFSLVFSISFILNAQEWEKERKLGPGGVPPVILIDTNNNIHILYYGVYYRKSIDGGKTWAEAVVLAPRTGFSPESDMALDSNNNPHVVFVSEVTEEGKFSIYYTNSTNGGVSWSTPERITWQQKHSSNPVIVIDSSNTIHVVWVDYILGEWTEESFCEFYYIRSQDGGNNWTEPVELQRGIYNGPLDMVIDSNDNIYAFMMFSPNETGQYAAYYSKSSDGGNTWSELKTPCKTPGCSQITPAIDSNNNIHLACETNVDETRFECYYLKSSNGGETWSEPRKLASHQHVTGLGWLAPICWIAVDSNNNPHVVHVGGTAGNLELYYLRSPDGGETWIESQRITNTPAHARRPRAAIDSNNNIINFIWCEVTYYSQENYSQECYHTRGLFTKPEPPTDLGATAVSINKNELTWNDNSNNEDGFKIERSLYADKEFNEVGFVLKNITSYIDTVLNPGTTYYYQVRACSGPAYSGYSNTASVTHGTIQLDRTQLYFGATTAGITAGSQRFLISNSGGGLLNWSVTTDKSWLNYTPSSGTGSGSVDVSIDAAGLSAGTYTGTVTVSDPTASNSPQTVSVTLTVHAVDLPPFGTFSTPVDNSIVRSSIPVTGWVLDDVGVESVKIYRHTNSGGGLAYVGDAVFVEGARPDVEQAYPQYPLNYKAGWGYMLLTYFLSGEGDGTYVIEAIASDCAGTTVSLGTKTVTVDNTNAVKPFGAIDTPVQGGSASGSNYRNHGWVLTPLPNNVPEDGSTINVYIDGLYLGHPVYNIFRSDIAERFPGYANSDGAHAYFDFDTTAYSNGIHTIYWTATDSAGNSDGIGSRYFSILNTGGNRKRGGPPVPSTGDFKDIPVYPDDNGSITIEIKELERVELDFFGSTFNISPLPIGSTLNTRRGIFYWQPGPGFVGNYEFEFIRIEGTETKKIMLHVRILPKFSHQ